MLGKVVIAAVLALSAASSIAATGVPATKSDLSAIKAAMDDRLKDSDSAKLKDVRVGKDGTTCGLVNAKNSYGAYAGYEPFIAMKLSVGSFYVLGVGDGVGDLCASKGF